MGIGTTRRLSHFFLSPQHIEMCECRRAVVIRTIGSSQRLRYSTEKKERTSTKKEIDLICIRIFVFPLENVPTTGPVKFFMHK